MDIQIPWMLRSSLSGLSEPHSQGLGLADQWPVPETLYPSPKTFLSQSPPPSGIIQGVPRPPVT